MSRALKPLETLTLLSLGEVEAVLSGVSHGTWQNTWARICPHVFAVDGLMLAPLDSCLFKFGGSGSLSLSEIQALMRFSPGAGRLIQG